MASTSPNQDTPVLDLLRRRHAMTVGELSELMGVTATAVRQRLTRLIDQGMVERQIDRSGHTNRGRPSHRYTLTDQGRRQTGANYADLAMALWQEIRKIEEPEVRRGLLTRIAGQLAQLYGDEIQGETVDEKMAALVEVFSQRQIPFDVSSGSELPVLTALACPYPDLAEQDRGVCAMEKQLFTALLGEDLRLAQCRLDGDSCCTFELKQPRSPLVELQNRPSETPAPN